MKVACRHLLVAALLTGLAATGTIPVQAKAAGPGGWSSAPDLLEGHVAHTATLLEDGRVLIVGGTNARGVPTAGSEIFDPKANRWIRAASMRTARAAHTATLLSDGSVLVTGGRTGLNSFAIETLATAQIYHPNSNSWTEASSMQVPRRLHSATRLHDGRVLVVGGTTLAPGSPLPAAQLEQAEVYDPRRDSWSFADTGLPALSSQAATLMPNGMVLVTGGSTDMGFATTDAEVFDPATNRWQPSTWPMATPRYGHTASLLPDGRVVLVGGYSTQPEVSGGRGYPNGELLTTSEIFDLRGNIGVRMGYSGIPRLDHTATLLGTGKVLIVGSAYASNADSQLFDPANTTDLVSTGLRMDRYLHTATLLGDGRVLIAGGYGVGSATTAWIYSPVSAASAGSTSIPLLQVGAALFVVVMVGIGLALSTRHLRRRRAGAVGELDSEWINP
jgi:Kelch motif protein/galactose oxidase-like protein